MMHRTKFLAAALALVVTASAATVLFGSASAASWHVYEGDIHAGHAYGLQVPADAQSYEIVFAGETGSARVAAFDPAGEKLGLYELGPHLTTAAIVEPAAGRHAIYVYDLADGALNVRVNSEEASGLALQKVPLARDDVEIGSGDGSAFAKATTVTLKQAPVFLTLLYEGSATNLDATVASGKGNVVTITDETGTAFSPGVWSSLSGQRTSDAANIDGLTYTVTVDAERFEGALTLTTLAMSLPSEVPFHPTPDEPTPPATPEPVVESAAPATTIVVEEGTAVEFTAAAGDLMLFDPSRLDQAEEDEHHARHHERGEYARFLVSIYAPDDSLVAYVDVHDYDGEERVELPVDGAYVAYVHYANNDAVALQLAQGDIADARLLEIVQDEYVFYTDGWSGSEIMFEMARAPVALHMRHTEESLGALSSAELTNEQGEVARLDSLAHAPYLQIFGWSDVNPENFAAGEHTLSTYALVPTGIEIRAISYLRDAVAAEEPLAEEADEESGIWDWFP